MRTGICTHVFYLMMDHWGSGDFGLIPRPIYVNYKIGWGGCAINEHFSIIAHLLYLILYTCQLSVEEVILCHVFVPVVKKFVL